MKTVDELIFDGRNGNFLDNMTNSIEIFGKHIMTPDVMITEVQNRYVSIFCCYVASFALYIKELSKSYDTLDFLSINAIGRSAVECYAIAKFIYLNFNEDTNKLFQLIIASDLKETSTLITKYELEVQNKSNLLEQLNNNKNIFSDILHIFPNADEWLANDSLSHKDIVKKLKPVLKENNIAQSVCNSDGFLGVSKLVSYVLKTNDFFEIIFNHKIEAEVYYDLMCSAAHNNYFNILKLFLSPDNFQFKVSLYPQHDEIFNKNSILKMLYANFIDLLACLDEINACIYNINKNPNCLFLPSKKFK